MSDETTEGTETTEETIPETTNETNDLVAKEDGVLNIEALCDAAKEMQPSGLELVSNYYDFEIGESVKLLPTGITRIEKLNPDKDDWENKKENEDKPMTNAIRFLNVEDGKMYITAAAVLAGALEKAGRENETAEVKKFYEISCIGEKEGKKGKYQLFSVQTLV